MNREALFKTTINHDEIKKWIDERRGKPVKIKDTDSFLRIDFPGFSEKGKFDELSWEDFFRIFDENHLALIYQEKTADGKESRFFKFINREL